MSTSDENTNQTDLDRLVEVWKVLEILTVSLDRIGEFWLAHGEEAAKEALLVYMGPKMSHKIAQARTLILSVMENYDLSILDRLEELAENEVEMGYWDGPKNTP